MLSQEVGGMTGRMIVGMEDGMRSGLIDGMRAGMRVAGSVCAYSGY